MSGRINVRYETTHSDGSRSVVGMFDVTEEQAALVQWLNAENAWHCQVKEQERQSIEQRRKTAEQRLAANRRLHVKKMHNALVNRASGFRRDVLMRHAPSNHFRGGPLKCKTCYTRDYEPERIEFPCGEYQFARDWVEDVPSDD